MHHISLTQHLIQQQQADPQRIDSELRLLIEVVARACKVIGVKIGKGALGGVLGEAGNQNVQGEAQKRLDVIANEIIMEANAWGGHLAAMASEEETKPIPISGKYPKGGYLLLFDPLDGSSNIDVNISVGTIFSVLRCSPDIENPTETSFLQAGTKQVAAGYALYGPSTLLVITIGDGVHCFTLDREMGAWQMTQAHMKIPPTTQEFAINMSNQRFWEAPIQRYIGELIEGKSGPRGQDFNMRWVASMVADVHRILTRGGVFMYPLDAKRKAQGGHLRLMYEANPMAFIVEQAGGEATTGTMRVLDIEPHALHQRVPVILGSKKEVDRVIDYHRTSR